METCSSFPCVLSVLQLCGHKIHRVDIHQHKLSIYSKWSDSDSDFLMTYPHNVGWGPGTLLVPVRPKFKTGIVGNICVLLFGFFTARHTFVFTMDKFKSKKLLQNSIFGSCL